MCISDLEMRKRAEVGRESLWLIWTSFAGIAKKTRRATAKEGSKEAWKDRLKRCKNMGEMVAMLFPPLPSVLCYRMVVWYGYGVV